MRIFEERVTALRVAGLDADPDVSEKKCFSENSLENRQTFHFSANKIRNKTASPTIYSDRLF